MPVNLSTRARLLYRMLAIKQSLHRNDALGALHRAWAYVHATQLIGDYYEFGVFQGASLVNSWLSYRHFRRRMEKSSGLPFQRRGSVLDFLAYQPAFHALDTFSGMPENDEGEDTLATGTFAANLHDVLALCRWVGLQEPDLRVIKGQFSENRDRLGCNPAAVVHLDCDLFGSTRDALEMIEPLLVQGTAVLFDDFNLFRADEARGQRRALREFLARGTIRFEPWFVYGAASQCFLCHR